MKWLKNIAQQDPIKSTYKVATILQYDYFRFKGKNLTESEEPKKVLFIYLENLF